MRVRLGALALALVALAAGARAGAHARGGGWAPALELEPWAEELSAKASTAHQVPDTFCVPGFFGGWLPGRPCHLRIDCTEILTAILPAIFPENGVGLLHNDSMRVVRIQGLDGKPGSLVYPKTPTIRN